MYLKDADPPRDAVVFRPRDTALMATEDNQEYLATVNEALGIRLFPTSCRVDQDDRVLFVHVGFQ